jgi:hypothetical protein
MCCLFTLLVFLGPRFAAIFWWLVQPLRWQSSFDTYIVPILGFIFLPWTLLMVVAVNPGMNGIQGFDWVWVGLAFAIDIMGWVGGGYGNRYQVYEYVPAAANPSIMPPTEPPVAPSKAAELPAASVAPVAPAPTGTEPPKTPPVSG